MSIMNPYSPQTGMLPSGGHKFWIKSNDRLGVRYDCQIEIDHQYNGYLLIVTQTGFDGGIICQQRETISDLSHMHRVAHLIKQRMEENMTVHASNYGYNRGIMQPSPQEIWPIKMEIPEHDIQDEILLLLEDESED